AKNGAQKNGNEHDSRGRLSPREIHAEEKTERNEPRDVNEYVVKVSPVAVKLLPEGLQKWLVGDVKDSRYDQIGPGRNLIPHNIPGALVKGVQANRRIVPYGRQLPA